MGASWSIRSTCHGRAGGGAGMAFDSSAEDNSDGSDGAELLAAAAEGRTGDVLKLLAKDPSLMLIGDLTEDTTLHLAARAGHSDTITKLIGIANEQANLRKLMKGVNVEGDTALHLALKNGHWQAAEHLVVAQPRERKAKDKAAFVLNKDGVSPYGLALLATDITLLELMWPTTKQFSTADVEMLLESITLSGMAEDDHNVEFKWSRLCDAVRKGLEDVVQGILAEDPGLVQHVDNDKDTALHVAATAGQVGTLRQLIRFILNSTELTGVMLQTGRSGNTVLHTLYIAVKKGHKDLTRYMINQISVSETMKQSLLSHIKRISLAHIAIKYSSLGMMRALMEELPCLIDSPDEKGWKPLSYAANKGHLSQVHYLLNRFPDSVNKHDKDGALPIHKAIVGGHICIIKEFLTCSPQTLYAIDKKGRTTLHIAVSYVKGDIFSYLIKKKGIEKIFNLRNDKGKTFKDLAEELKNGDAPRAI